MQATLQEWGTACFDSLFQKQARDWFQDARRQGLENLTLKIASNDPRVLAWPWEALHDPEGGILAHHCRIERQLSELHDPQPLPANLPKDRINILLVIARPYGDKDVGFHALSRPLVELTKAQNSPVHIDVLRPPTFDQLRQTLRNKPGFYHIVHFDGHGGYGTPGHTSPHAFKGMQGMLVFEDDHAEPANVEAGVLSQLMAEHRIPIMVLNACQSAKIDEQADDAFASVATALLKAGIRSVVAMGYNLYVSGAQQFVPAFYQRLLSSGNVAEAARAGRQAMLAHPERVCVLGEYNLQDWLVPVLYQQLPPGEAVLPDIQRSAPAFVFPGLSEIETPLPDEAQYLGDYGFIGRERAVQALERARLQQPQAAFLIHGMAGIGKTTLAKGFLHWLYDTNGLAQDLPNGGVFWFSFDEIRSAEYVINAMVDPLFGINARAAPLPQKVEALIKALREHPFLLVWDNFESASGITGTEVTALLPEDDRQLLKDLLKRLRGGKTKVLITSRSPENWLTPQECYRLPLFGLQGEELWEYCNAVVRDLGLKIDRKNQDYLGLIQELGGSPLAIRIILLRLHSLKPADLLKELKQKFIDFGDDRSESRLFAAFNFFSEYFSGDFELIFKFICLHEKIVDKNHIRLMIEKTGGNIKAARLDEGFDLLIKAGLLQDMQETQQLYKIHPMLGSFLKATCLYNEEILFSFVIVMSSFANQLFRSAQPSRKLLILIFSGNFFKIINLCEENDKLHSYFTLVTHGMAWVYSEEYHDYQVSYWLFDKLIKYHSDRKEDELLSSIYHAAGNTAYLQQNNELARDYYVKSMLIDKGNADEQHKMLNLYALGNVELRASNWIASEDFYKIALAIARANDDHNLIAMSIHQLGVINEEQKKYHEAMTFYKESYEIKKQFGSEFDLSYSYFHFGRVHMFLHQYLLAQQWFKKALVLSEKYGSIDVTSLIYHNLGMIKEKEGHIYEAEKFYQQSLTIKEKILDFHGIASTCGRLGDMCFFSKDYDSAALWFVKAMDNYVRCSDRIAAFLALDGYKNSLELVDNV
ncbi:tetratricopeptide repeat protein [Candidatus Thiothrix anitrata]|uniref:Tetratricopeptide repeat protein n=1 Tax=Candidatus Thiothrix anitrata TaxID=2823902 RepID=A0ABX7WYW6_9GAMM|nr:tetratricopeptide repeat protein [Candidatus Thiothrix anitrata]QTR48924.1 tetratricopeptide repeat protein [Candidatus Thiothrix anitrata]